MSFTSEFASAASQIITEFSDGDFSYTPFGGAPKSIKGIITEGVQTVKGGSEETENYDIREIEILSADDTVGHIDPKAVGRSGGGPDSLTIPGDVRTWYVHEIIQDGRSGTGVHRLLIADTDGPLIDD